MCFNQLRLFNPNEIISLSHLPTPTLHLSIYSNSRYDDWRSVYNSISTFETMHPIYLFHDQNGFGKRLIETLKLFSGINPGIMKLLQLRE